LRANTRPTSGSFFLHRHDTRPARNRIAAVGVARARSTNPPAPLWTVIAAWPTADPVQRAAPRQENEKTTARDATPLALICERTSQSRRYRMGTSSHPPIRPYIAATQASRFRCNRYFPFRSRCESRWYPEHQDRLSGRAAQRNRCHPLDRAVPQDQDLRLHRVRPWCPVVLGVQRGPVDLAHPWVPVVLGVQRGPVDLVHP